MVDKTMKYIDPQKGLDAKLEPCGNMLATKHLFEPEDIDAINAAIACRRPLLLTGDPGTGKSQLARAAAVSTWLRLRLIRVDSRTESRDLLWRFDAVGRLADANVGKALNADPSCCDRTRPFTLCSSGPLWWGFHWQGARNRLSASASVYLMEKMP